MVVPSLVFDDLHSERHRFDRYWETLKSADVGSPDTKIIKFNDGQVPVDKIKDFMDKAGYKQVFVRTGYKSATDRFREGSIVSKPTREEIERTVESLLNQHISNEIPHGNMLVIREVVDLNYCTEVNHSHHSELRYFVEDGEILYRTPRDFNPVPDCPADYEFVRENLSECQPPESEAKEVAKVFEDTGHSWSVDFVLDNKGNWWVTEMHLNGVYYNDDHNKWLNICGHGDQEEKSPLWIHEPVMYNNSPNS